ncbi:MAG: hypothetical protein JJ879_13900 [Sneathiella sp.]|nr:hypothetical protein [Sneathiella sp.]
MASTVLSKKKQEIANNLVDTCGPERAIHAAKQFGWHDIAKAIKQSAAEQSVIQH